VGNQLGVNTEVGAVLLNLLADKRTELSRGESLLLVNICNHLLVRLHNLVSWNPGVVGSHHGSPLLVLHTDVVTDGERTLVLVRVLELSSAVNTDDTSLGTLDTVDLVHCLLVIVGDDLVGAVHGLTVLTGLETPLDVLGWGLLQVVIDVSESVLLDVGDTDVLVLVDVTGGWDKLTSQDVDQSRLSGTVWTNDGNTGSERALEGDVLDLRTWSTWVLEGHVGDTNDGLGLGLDTLEETWLWELELNLRGTELVVGFGGWDTLDELGELTTVTLQLEALVVDDVLNDVVQELGVVGDDDGSARRGDEVVLEPSNVLDIHVVGWLVEKEDIWLLENGTAKSQLHLPTTGQGGDWCAELLVDETELKELAVDLVLGSGDTDFLELLHGPANNGLLSVVRVKVVLNVNSLDLALLWETLDLLVVDGAHKSGLAGTVWSKETVTLTTLETEVGLVEKNLGTVGQVEGAVTEILTLLLVRLNGVGSSSEWGGVGAELLGDLLGVLLTGENSDVWKSVGGPAGAVGVLLVDKLSGDSGNVVENWLELWVLGSWVLIGEKLLEVTEDGVDLTSLGGLWDLSVNDTTDTGEGVETLLGLLAGLWVSDGLVVLDQSWHQTRQESSDNVRVLDKLAHVVNNDSGLSLDGSLTLGKTTLEKRNHNGQSWLVNVSDESGGTEKMNSLWDVLWLGDTLDQLWNETLDIPVGDQSAKLLHGTVGSLLDLRLGVPHGLGDDWKKIWHANGSLS